jgi:DNA-directed RNA polymerase specialized sigma24 family protein
MRPARASNRDGLASEASADVEAMRSAFAQLHARSLHGFALLLVPGEAARARELATASLAAGLTNVLALRHPERAAAWLRADVLRAARRRRSTSATRGDTRALVQLGMAPEVGEALARLDLEQRAAVIAADVERLDPRDVDTILGRNRDSGARFLARARRRYLAAFSGPPSSPGPVSQRISAIAASVGRFGSQR